MALPDRSLPDIPSEASYWPVVALMSSPAPALACSPYVDAEPVSLDGAPSDPEHDLAWVERKNLAVRDQIEGMLTQLLQHRERIF
jgi:hypothetical protein